MTYSEIETLVTELTARVDSLEDTVEELRYAGPVTQRPTSIEYDMFLDDDDNIETGWFLDDI